MSEGRELRLSKHHAAGNDFIVSIDLDARRPFSVAEARALSDRHRGVGADGLLRLLAGDEGAALSMELRNSDGSCAEISGNGIRCLVQAAVEAGVVGEGVVSVKTGAGLRRVDYETRGPGLGWAAVDMGHVVLGAELALTDLDKLANVDSVQMARSVELGNPHVVLVCAQVSDEMVSTTGELLQRSFSGGVNVEFVVHEAGAETLDVRVFERGAGETLSCGSGACAAAAAARSWGLVGNRVDVNMPGGTLKVELEEDCVVLTGPTRRVAEIVVRESELAELVGELEAGPSRGTPVGPAGEVVGRL